VYYAYVLQKRAILAEYKNSIIGIYNRFRYPDRSDVYTVHESLYTQSDTTIAESKISFIIHKIY